MRARSVQLLFSMLVVSPGIWIEIFDVGLLDHDTGRKVVIVI